MRVKKEELQYLVDQQRGAFAIKISISLVSRLLADLAAAREIISNGVHPLDETAQKWLSWEVK